MCDGPYYVVTAHDEFHVVNQGSLVEHDSGFTGRTICDEPFEASALLLTRPGGPRARFCPHCEDRLFDLSLERDLLAACGEEA